MGVLLAAGVLFWLIADFTFLIAPPRDRSASCSTSGGWQAPPCSRPGAGEFLNPATPMPRALDQKHVQARLAGIALPIAPLLVPGFIELVSFTQGQDANPVPLFVGTSRSPRSPVPGRCGSSSSAIVLRRPHLE